MDDHEGCRDELRRGLAKACFYVGEPGMDLHISTEPPLVKARFIVVTCPHDTKFYIEPTGEQRARWVQEARHS